MEDMEGVGGQGGLYGIISSNVIFIATGHKIKGYERGEEWSEVEERTRNENERIVRGFRGEKLPSTPLLVMHQSPS